MLISGLVRGERVPRRTELGTDWTIITVARGVTGLGMISYLCTVIRLVLADVTPIPAFQQILTVHPVKDF